MCVFMEEILIIRSWLLKRTSTDHKRYLTVIPLLTSHFKRTKKPLRSAWILKQTGSHYVFFLAGTTRARPGGSSLAGEGGGKEGSRNSAGLSAASPVLGELGAGDKGEFPQPASTNQEPSGGEGVTSALGPRFPV